MTDQTAQPPDKPSSPLRTWGFWSVAIGAAALVLVFVQIIGPTVEPQPSAGTRIGEIAGEIKRSAWRTFLGFGREEPVPEPVSAMNYMALAAPVLGVVAIIGALISTVLRENWRYGVYATGLGASAIVFHFVWWIVLLVVGALIIVAIIENIGDIFSF